MTRETTLRDAEVPAPPARTEERVLHDEERVPRDGVAGRWREDFAGLNWGAACYGWLVAIGITTLLTALLGAAGAAIGLTELTGSEARSSAETLSLVGGALLILVLALGYYAGGYVAGRMSRFDGARQGLGVWAVGLLATLLLAALAALAGAEYNLFADLNLPRIPIDEGSLATGAGIALAVAVLATALAAIAGGSVGRRYHRRVDEALAADRSRHGYAGRGGGDRAYGARS